MRHRSPQSAPPKQEPGRELHEHSPVLQSQSPWPEHSKAASFVGQDRPSPTCTTPSLADMMA